MSPSDLTPLLKQYRDVKREHRDSILLFRVGDFYEMFFEDATEAASLLNITLTSRDKQSANPVPLCGIPYHAATGYLAKLLKAGKTVALCEQVEDPKTAKGLVRREVVRVYTPGTVFDDELLDAKAANFLAAVSLRIADDARRFGLAAVDLSTGQFLIADCAGEHGRDDLLDELVRLGPREVLVPESMDADAADVRALLASLRLPRVTAQPSAWFEARAAQALLRSHFAVERLEDLGLTLDHPGVPASGGVLQYLKQTQPILNHRHIQRPEIREAAREMHLDAMTIRNLELVRPLNHEHKQSTLLSVLDHTVTAMGSRLLRQWIVRPLTDRDAIQRRLHAVSALQASLKIRLHLRTLLRELYDLERLSSRVGMGTATPRDLLCLKESLHVLPKLIPLFESIDDPVLASMFRRWDPLADVAAVLEAAIDPQAPASAKEGAVIRDGFDAVIDELRTVERDSTQWLTDLEQRERQHTGIESLKIKYNQVSGYSIEVTKANLSRVPEYFQRKQTLANAERYMTDELQRLETRISGAQAQVRRAEYERFQSVLQDTARHVFRIQAMARQAALLDVLVNFAEVASRHGYVKPDIHEGGVIAITDGRHPVVEQFDLHEGFIPNDCHLDLESHRLLLITGPNMAGKSTFLRQVGLIALMAHIGCFVPAAKARVGVIDRIFTRVGASDNLAFGLSTFMVEMLETARILQGATSRSLVLLDEIGRGTSTYDGLSLAWAIAEHLHDRGRLGARTLFATHYHEMTDLEHRREGVQNLTVAVKEEKDQVIFLRKITPGKADRSYGIHVGKLAGLPSTIIARAEDILAQLEHHASSETMRANLRQHDDRPHDTAALPPSHPLIEEIKQLDLFAMTPLEALNRLADIQQRLDAK